MSISAVFKTLAAAVALTAGVAFGQERAVNPNIWSDVPDVAVVKVGDEWYMSSTTMHMCPGVPIMKSKNLVDWNLVGYAYDILEDVDALALRDGKNAYGAGSWASSLRYRDGRFYLMTFAGTTGKTYVYSTDDPSGKWDCKSFRPMCHDCSLFFDDDGKAYVVYGSGNIRLTELKPDLSGFQEGGVDKVIVERAERVAGGQTGLPAEGSQLFKKDGKYYLCNITWPAGDMRTETVYRADRLEGPYEGRVFLKDRGIAQGTIFEGPKGQWYAYMFQDAGAVGRIPYLLPVEWKDGWPVVAGDGKAPAELDIVREGAPLGNIVSSDEFNSPERPLAWQWNHNPDPDHFAFDTEKGVYRITTSRVDARITEARNSLTQRVFGPTCSGTIAVDPSGMKDGDFAGLCLLQRKYGCAGIEKRGGRYYIAQKESELSEGSPAEDGIRENASVALEEAPSKVWFRAECDFRDRRDVARFFWSLDGENWTEIGSVLRMAYTLPHFMGQRFALFNYATQEPGGSVEFDFFRVGE